MAHTCAICSEPIRDERNRFIRAEDVLRCDVCERPVCGDDDCCDRDHELLYCMDCLNINVPWDDDEVDYGVVVRDTHRTIVSIEQLTSAEREYLR